MTPRFVGVDGAPDGWIAVRYDDEFVDVTRYGNIEKLWAENEDAETILVDIPIGLREASAEPRECDAAARKYLSPRRHTSVFPVPIRAAAHKKEYEDAKAEQEEKTEGSLGVQSHAIADKIRELDDLLRADTDARETIRESHPEVCFAALNGGEPMTYSKTGQPAAAFWERAAVLEAVDDDFRDHLWTAGETIADWDAPECSNDDLLDAFALALTASDQSNDLATLPEDPDTDGERLPMEIVYATA